MKKKSEKLVGAFDPETLLHPGHIRDGGSGYGRRTLTEKQQSAVAGLVGALAPKAYALLSDSSTVVL